VTQEGRLRVITYLAPSIPERFFRVIADHLGQRLGTGAELSVEAGTSGPLPETIPSSGTRPMLDSCAPRPF
jgi:hypothetical protein